METSTQPSGVQNSATKSAAATQDSADLLAKARGDADAVLNELGSQPDGLSEAEAATRLQQVGTNEIAREHRQSSAMRLLTNSKNPLVLLLLALVVILTSLIIVAGGAWLTVSPLAGALGFVPPPPLYWLFLALMLIGYALLTQVVKTWFIRKVGE